jgi:type I restriction enzyme S subunit
MSFPRYPAYKDSGVEWLGEVPEHWNRTALKFLADYQNGYPFKPEDRGTEGLPIIRISQLTGDDEPAYYSGVLDERVKVRDSDLLFTWSATIDSFIWDKGEAWLNQHIFRVSPSAEADKRYLYYVIKHVAPKLADFDAHGSTMRHIKKESLGEKVYVPSVRDQGLIANFLDRETAKIDALIAEQQRLIKLLQEKRQAVISHAVTKGLNPDAPMKDSGVEWLGEVPEHWEVKRIKHTSRMESGHTPDRKVEAYWVNCDIPWVSLNDTGFLKDNDYISETAYCINDLGIRNSSARLLPERVVVFSRDATIGRCAITTRQMAVSQHFIAWVCGDEILPEFLLLRLKSMTQELDRLTFGATLKTIGMPDVKTLVTPIPPIKEQKGIVEHLKGETARLEGMSASAQQAVSLLQERRSVLISAAVTGQIDVRGLVPEAEAA